MYCIGELGLRHDYPDYEGFRVARESAVEQDKIEMMRHMDQLCGVVDYLKDQVRTEEPKIYFCEPRRSKEVCAICMMD